VNGSERLDSHGGRRLTVPGVGLVEVIHDASGTVTEVVTTEQLSPEQHERLLVWLEHDWPKRASGLWS
jgi:hypothetical protein